MQKFDFHVWLCSIHHLNIDLAAIELLLVVNIKDKPELFYESFKRFLYSELDATLLMVCAISLKSSIFRFSNHNIVLYRSSDLVEDFYLMQEDWPEFDNSECYNDEYANQGDDSREVCRVIVPFIEVQGGLVLSERCLLQKRAHAAFTPRVFTIRQNLVSTFSPLFHY